MKDLQEEHIQTEEVLGFSESSSKEDHATVDKGDSQSSSHRWLPFTEQKEFYAFAVVALCVLPIVLLAALAPHLSSKLGSSACLPDGQFVIPGTVSIWNPQYIFTITLAFGTNYGSDWTYARVKVIDLLWDVLVGRGGQVILVWLAYWVFHRSLLHIMQTRAVPYRTYGAAAFDTGLVSSLIPYLSALLSKKQRPSTRARCIYAGMALTTLYIVAMPTLFSAMTGYTPIPAPSVETVHGIFRESATPDYCKTEGHCTITQCDQLYPIWGIMWDSARLDKSHDNVSVHWGAPQYILDTEDLAQDVFYRYYKKYESDYKAAAQSAHCVSHVPNSNLSNCQPLEKPSYLAPHGGKIGINVSSPLLNIEVLGTDDDGIPKAFMCDSTLKPLPFFTHEILEGKYGTRGLCQSGPYYQWGFSFLLLFIVAVLNLIFAAILYGLWIDARRNGNVRGATEIVETKCSAQGNYTFKRYRMVNSPSHLRNVLNMADQAERYYGPNVRDWPSWKLSEEIWSGEEGMRVRDVRPRPLLEP